MSFIVLILAATAALGNSQLVDWYHCPPNCTGPCVCASSKAPVDNPPQFILLTHDDAVNSASFATVLKAIDGLSNRNDCPLPVTWYVSIVHSLPELVEYLYHINHEIADHSYNHDAYPSWDDIMCSKNWLNEAGVPKAEIRGFRAPYLQHDVDQRQSLYSLGFSYDSSISQLPDTAQLFPYTLDYGVAIDCSRVTGTCTEGESYPGMWSVPLWALENQNSLDVTGDIYTQFMNDFEKKYYGNRSPVGLFFHSGWLSQKTCAFRKLLTDMLKHEDVWVVTTWQLIEWMQNPVSADEYRAKMTSSDFCPRTPIGNMPPLSGCLHGKWNPFLHQCDCNHEHDFNSNGFCRGSTGACDQGKLYENGRWLCLPVEYVPENIQASCTDGFDQQLQGTIAEDPEQITTYSSVEGHQGAVVDVDMAREVQHEDASERMQESRSSSSDATSLAALQFQLLFLIIILCVQAVSTY